MPNRTTKENRSGIPVRKILLPVLLAAAAGCILFGILRGEVPSVVTKAVNICLECIGLGQ